MGFENVGMLELTPDWTELTPDWTPDWKTNRKKSIKNTSKTHANKLRRNCL
jgi:hypothetical protein